MLWSRLSCLHRTPLRDGGLIIVTAVRSTYLCVSLVQTPTLPHHARLQFSPVTVAVDTSLVCPVVPQTDAELLTAHDHKTQRNRPSHPCFAFQIQPNQGAPTRPCTLLGHGQCDSTPDSVLPRSPTRSTDETLPPVSVLSAPRTLVALEAPRLRRQYLVTAQSHGSMRRCNVKRNPQHSSPTGCSLSVVFRRAAGSERSVRPGDTQRLRL